MGATLWHHESPWHDDPADALDKLQADFVAANYDLCKLIPQFLENARQSVAQCEADGDEYGLLGIYQQQVERLEWLAAEAIPTDSKGKVEIVRKLYADSGQGIGNVLDLLGVANERRLFHAHILSERDIKRFTGTTSPSRSEGRAAISAINSELGRGECVCLPIYDVHTPIAWMFVANTVD